MVAIVIYNLINEKYESNQRNSKKIYIFEKINFFNKPNKSYSYHYVMFLIKLPTSLV